MDKFIGATFNDVDGFELTFTDITSTDNIWRYLDQVFLPLQLLIKRIKIFWEIFEGKRI